MGSPFRIDDICTVSLFELAISVCVSALEQVGQEEASSGPCCSGAFNRGGRNDLVH